MIFALALTLWLGMPLATLGEGVPAQEILTSEALFNEWADQLPDGWQTTNFTVCADTLVFWVERPPQNKYFEITLHPANLGHPATRWVREVAITYRTAFGAYTSQEIRAVLDNLSGWTARRNREILQAIDAEGTGELCPGMLNRTTLREEMRIGGALTSRQWWLLGIGFGGAWLCGRWILRLKGLSPPVSAGELHWKTWERRLWWALLAWALMFRLAHYSAGLENDEAAAYPLGVSLSLLNYWEVHYQPPLWSLVGGAWSWICVHPDWMRLLTLTLGVGAVGAAGLLARVVYGREAALGTMFILGLNPMLASHARVLRPYALFIFLFTLALYFWAQACRTGEARWWRRSLWAWGGSLWASYSILTPLAVTVAFLPALGRGKAAFRAGVLTLMGVGLLFLPLIPALLKGIALRPHEYNAGRHPEVVFSSGWDLLNGEVLGGALLIWLLLILCLGVWKGHRETLWLGLVAFGGLLFFEFYRNTSPIRSRYLIFLLPPLITAAIGAVSLFKKRWVAVAMVLFLWNAMPLITQYGHGSGMFSGSDLASEDRAFAQIIRQAKGPNVVALPEVDDKFFFFLSPVHPADFTVVEESTLAYRRTDGKYRFFQVMEDREDWRELASLCKECWYIQRKDRPLPAALADFYRSAKAAEGSEWALWRLKQK